MDKACMSGDPCAQRRLELLHVKKYKPDGDDCQKY